MVKRKRPFVCDICGKESRDKGHANRHRATHTMLRSKCTGCGGLFKELPRHIKKGCPSEGEQNEGFEIPFPSSFGRKKLHLELARSSELSDTGSSSNSAPVLCVQGSGRQGSGSRSSESSAYAAWTWNGEVDFRPESEDSSDVFVCRAINVFFLSSFRVIVAYRHW